MRTPRQLLCLVIWTSLFLMTGCSSFSGNVIPQSGPDMESVYDSMHHPVVQTVKPKSIASSTDEVNDLSNTDSDNDDDLKTIRHHVTTAQVYPNDRRASGEFRKLANPELRLYVFPHFAGKDQVPVPGYHTVFNAYDHDHYALASERG